MPWLGVLEATLKAVGCDSLSIELDVVRSQLSIGPMAEGLLPVQVCIRSFPQGARLRLV